ncbi:MAG: hypothetical protein HLUCCA01_03630 [Bacteroidetes bacterium HLUCCA01]|nr:MAG: hypothetical protein HLUCCA01_03630 [Bacteroidetes bacterium HLUCCA01]
MIPNRLHNITRLAAVLLLLLPSVSAFASCGGAGWFCPMSAGSGQSCCSSGTSDLPVPTDADADKQSHCSGCHDGTDSRDNAQHSLLPAASAAAHTCSGHQLPASDPQAAGCDSCDGCQVQSAPEALATQGMVVPAPTPETLFVHLTEILEESHPATTPVTRILHHQALQQPPQTLFVLHQSFLN